MTNPFGLTIDDLKENFELFDDWEDRYHYLLDLAKKLPPLTDAERSEANKVTGCMSQVWLVADVIDGPPPTLVFRADSDAQIVKGLIAVLLILFSGKTPGEILAIDAEQAFRDLDLESHISPNRRNGFVSMIDKIKGLATASAGA